MPLTISDESLRAMQLDAPDARVEIACLLFDAGRMSFGHAARLAGVDLDAFDRALEARDLPRYRYTEEMLKQDFQAFKSLGRSRDAASISRGE